jgi:7-carboxy-7-deazaguanine synthase
MMFDAIGPLSRACRDAGLHVTIETAGTILRTEPEIACDLMSLSPKLSNSTPPAGDPRDPKGSWRIRHEARRHQPAVLQGLLDAFPARQFKFVVTGEDDLREIDAMLDGLHGWRPEDVMLMPEGTESPDPTRVAWVVRCCLERGWRYCHRLHVELFGDTRGT